MFFYQIEPAEFEFSKDEIETNYETDQQIVKQEITEDSKGKCSDETTGDLDITLK